MAKRKRTNNDLKHTHKTEDRVTRTALNNVNFFYFFHERFSLSYLDILNRRKTIKWSKGKGQKDKQLSTKILHRKLKIQQLEPLQKYVHNFYLHHTLFELGDCKN